MAGIESRWLLNPGSKRRRRAKGAPARKRRKRNPSVLSVVGPNPPKGAKMARRRHKRRGVARRRPVRRRRRRVTAFAHNPPRRRRRRHTIGRSRRRYRRNPGGGLRSYLPTLKRLIAGTAGVAGTRFVSNQVTRYMPGMMTGPVANLAVRGACAVGLGMLVGRFAGRQAGEDFAFGGLLDVTNDLAQTYIYPRIGLSAYLDTYTGVGAYLDTGTGVGDFIAPGQSVPSLPSLAGGPDGSGLAGYGEGYGDVLRLDAEARY